LLYFIEIALSFKTKEQKMTDADCEPATQETPKSFYDLSAKDINGKIINFESFKGILL